MRLRDLAPRPTERGVLVGCSGSGKTTLAKHLLPLYPVVLAIDPKCTLGADASGRGNLPGFLLVRRPQDLRNAGKRSDRVQYRPDPEFQTQEYWEQVYGWAFQRRNTFVYTDEAYLIMEGNRTPDAVRACITSGRERGIGMLTATQRPAGIDLRVMSEAERFYCFRLRKRDDRKRMVDVMESEAVLAPAPGHAFWYCRSGADPRLLNLAL